MKIANNTVALEFNAVTAERRPFVMSRLKGSKILLSFFRNGSCTLSNHRLHLLKKHSRLFLEKNLHVVCVFESMPKDILPFAGRAEAPFHILADPMALLYDMYGIENDDSTIRHMLAAGLLTHAIEAAAEAGFPWVPQEESNFFRMPADFLIDEDFIVRDLHYSVMLTDRLPIGQILSWLDKKSIAVSPQQKGHVYNEKIARKYFLPYPQVWGYVVNKFSDEV